MPNKQQIPAGYKMVRRRGTELFSFMVESEGNVRLGPGVWLSKAETLDAMWQHFREQACGRAARELSVFVLDCVGNSDRVLLPEHVIAARSSPEAA